MRSVHKSKTAQVARASRLLVMSGAASVGLAGIKISTGVLGNSYALIADGIESLLDVLASVVVLLGLRLSLRPADELRPWGYGKLETFSTLFVSGALVFAGFLIAVQSVHEILTPHHTPAWFTLPVLLLVVIVKVFVSKLIRRAGSEVGSTVLEADSWHHLSDALTSGAAFVGITIAMVGGEGWESADDWAALVACGIILLNGGRLAREGLLELLESRAPQQLESEFRRVAGEVEGVCGVEKLRARKSGMGYIMEVHIEVDGEISVTAGHDISGAVKAALLRAGLSVIDVIVHVEPHAAEGRSKRRSVADHS